jgi:hypothetical protein
VQPPIAIRNQGSWFAADTDLRFGIGRLPLFVLPKSDTRMPTGMGRFEEEPKFDMNASKKRPWE